MTEKTVSDKNEIVVFDIIRESKCSECGDELWRGSFIVLEDHEPVCLRCADLDHLEYLPRGNAALTRRSRKHSRWNVVVVRWSRSRKRYERQGVMAEPEAITRAEKECLDDAEARERRRERARARRAQLDAEYVAAFARRIREMWPGCPESEARSIARHACRKHSGRIGRTAAAKELDPSAIGLAVRAAIRHRHTRYCDLLASGWDRREARHEVEEEVWEVLEAWRKPEAIADNG